LQPSAASFASFLAPLSPFPKGLFLRDGPGDGRHDNRKNDKPIDLLDHTIQKINSGGKQLCNAAYRRVYLYFFLLSFEKGL
jgi:hypothetical protein